MQTNQAKSYESVFKVKVFECHPHWRGQVLDVLSVSWIDWRERENDLGWVHIELDTKTGVQ